MQGVQRPGKPGNFREFQCKGKSQGKVREFCCVELIFSQSEHPNFENFLWEHAPDPLNSLGHTQEFNRSREKSGKCQGILSVLESGHPDNESSHPV